MAIPKPVTVTVVPLNKGKDISIPATAIDQAASPDLMNMRFWYGQLQTRSGFKKKYSAEHENIFWIEKVYSASGATIGFLALHRTFMSQKGATGVFRKLQLTAYTPGALTGDCTDLDTRLHKVLHTEIDTVGIGTLIGDGTDHIPANTIVVNRIKMPSGTHGYVDMSTAAALTHAARVINISKLVTLTTAYASDCWTLNYGSGLYIPKCVNTGTSFPASGYGWIIIATNGQDGIVVLFVPESGVNPDNGNLAAEVLYDLAGVGLADALTAHIFDGRLIVGGTSSSTAEILWSAQTRFDDFLTTGWGSVVLGDTIDDIQRMMTLGEFLVVYKERSIYMGRKTGLASPALQFNPLPANGVGTPAPFSIDTIGDAHFFLGWDDVYMLTLSGLKAVGTRIRDELFGRSGTMGIRPDYIRRCVGVCDTARGEYQLYIPTGRIPAATNLLRRGAMDFLYNATCTIDGAASVVTITEANPGVVTLNAHGKKTGDKVRFTTTGTLPTNLAINTDYWVIYVNPNTFQLATTYANCLVPTPIDTSGAIAALVHTARFASNKFSISSIPGVAYVRIGDGISSTAFPSGAKVVAVDNTWVYADMMANDFGAATITIGNVDGWAITTAIGGVGTQEVLGNFGELCFKAVFTTSTHSQVTFTSGLIACGPAKELLLQVWLKNLTLYAPTGALVSPEAGKMYLYAYDVGGNLIAGSVKNSALHTYTDSWRCEVQDNQRVQSTNTPPFLTPANTSFIQIVIRFDGNTINNQYGATSSFWIDAVQVCDITGIDTTLFGAGTSLPDVPTESWATINPVVEHLVSAYGNHVAPGFPAASGQAVLPFIADEVGPWMIDTCYVYNYVTDSWSIWRFPLFGYGFDVSTISDTIASLSGNVSQIAWRYDDQALTAQTETTLITQGDGQVYEMGQGYGNDWGGMLDAGIYSYFQSKDFDLGAPEVDKTVSRVILYHEVGHAAVPVDVAISTDSGLTWSTQSVILRTGFSETFADFFITGNHVRFRVLSAERALYLNGVALKIIPRGEINAY